MQISLRNKLAYVRFGQMAFIFGIGLAINLFSTISHSWWIFLTVIVLSSAVSPGLVIKTSIYRARGTLIALVLMLPLIYLLHFNYRLVTIVFILMGVFIAVPHAKRYDLSVIFMTLYFRISAVYTSSGPLNENPVTTTISFGISTIIGIIICIGGDYLLFNRFNYSYKVYSLWQYELCNMLEDTLNLLCTAKQKNSVLVVEGLRDNFNQTYNNIIVSGESILYSLNKDQKTINMVKEFEVIAWRLRKIIFAVYYAEYILNDSEISIKYQEQFRKLMIKAKQNFIIL